MKITDIVNESTTAGAIATVSAPMTTQKRSGVGKGVYGNEKAGNLLTGKKTNKKYANSISESKMKQVATDLETMQDGNFKQKYGKSKEHMMTLLGTPANMKPKSKYEVNEAQLEEEDKLIDPKKGHKRKTGLHGKDEEQRLSQFKQPFKSSGDFVSDSRGNSVCECENEDLAKEVAKALNAYVKKDESVGATTAGVIAGGGVGEGIGEKIKGAIRREKAKDMPLVQTRRDYAMGKAGDAYNKGEIRKGNQYSAYAEKDRKKKNDPTTNPAGTYRTKTRDYTNENAWNQLGQRKPNTNLPAPDRGSRVNHGRHFEEGDIVLPLSGPLKGQPHKVIHSQRTSIRIVPLGRDSYPGDTIAPRTKHEWVVPAEVNEAQSMGTALKNTLAKAEPGSKLDNSIKSHNRHIKAGLPGTLKNAPTGYHFDSKGYCRLGDK